MDVRVARHLGAVPRSEHAKGAASAPFPATLACLRNCATVGVGRRARVSPRNQWRLRRSRLKRSTPAQRGIGTRNRVRAEPPSACAAGCRFPATVARMLASLRNCATVRRKRGPIGRRGESRYAGAFFTRAGSIVGSAQGARRAQSSTHPPPAG
jgi:hypothetical protein